MDRLWVLIYLAVIFKLEITKSTLSMAAIVVMAVQAAMAGMAVWQAMAALQHP